MLPRALSKSVLESASLPQQMYIAGIVPEGAFKHGHQPKRSQEVVDGHTYLFTS